MIHISFTLKSNLFLDNLPYWGNLYNLLIPGAKTGGNIQNKWTTFNLSKYILHVLTYLILNKKPRVFRPGRNNIYIEGNSTVRVILWTWYTETVILYTWYWIAFTENFVSKLNLDWINQIYSNSYLYLHYTALNWFFKYICIGTKYIR